MPFSVVWLLVKLVDLVIGFTTDAKCEIEGLDRTEHGEIGFDYGLSLEAVPRLAAHEPRPAILPPDGHKRFTVVVEGVENNKLIDTWSELCQAGTAPPTPDFRNVYPYMTTVRKNRFQFRGGDPATCGTAWSTCSRIDWQGSRCERASKKIELTLPVLTTQKGTGTSHDLSLDPFSDSH